MSTKTIQAWALENQRLKAQLSTAVEALERVKSSQSKSPASGRAWARLALRQIEELDDDS